MQSSATSLPLNSRLDTRRTILSPTGMPPSARVRAPRPRPGITDYDVPGRHLGALNSPCPIAPDCNPFKQRSLHWFVSSRPRIAHTFSIMGPPDARLGGKLSIADVLAAPQSAAAAQAVCDRHEHSFSRLSAHGRLWVIPRPRLKLRVARVGGTAQSGMRDTVRTWKILLFSRGTFLADLACTDKKHRSPAPRRQLEE